MLESDTVSEAERRVQADVAHLLAMIERASADLALAEEPSNFVVALEQGARDE